MKADDDALMVAARRATEVLDEFEAKKRIEAGYTRIDAEQIASASDVVVMYRKLELLLGGFLREDGIPGIIVNWDRPRGLVHMTCAHELGHFALGHESSSDTTVDIPKNAALVWLRKLCAANIGGVTACVIPPLFIRCRCDWA
jgi:Zn-dependent peptidase ImmA (M78 family)